MDSFSVNPDRNWRNQPLVREPDSHRTRWMWCAALSMFLAAAPVGIYMWQQNECMKLNYGVEALRAEHERLLESERLLRIRRASLESLPDIEIWAKDRRGLTRPDATRIISVRNADSTTEPLVARDRTRD